MNIKLDVIYTEELFDYGYLKGIAAKSSYRGVPIMHAIKLIDWKYQNIDYHKNYLYNWLHDWAYDLECFDKKYHWMPIKIKQFVFKIFYKRRYIA